MDPDTHHYGRDFYVKPVSEHIPIRQFEFGGAPETYDLLATGTTNGCSLLFRLSDLSESGRPAIKDTVIMNNPFSRHSQTAEVIGAVRYCGMSRKDTVLALCWLKNHPGRYVCGSAGGRTVIVDCSPLLSSPLPSSDLSSPLPSSPHLSEASDFVPELPVLHRYKPLADLTCIHVNCDDKYLLASGYSLDIPIFDVETGQVVRTYYDAHSAHINITRFASTSPNIFASSSFDSTVKVWDLRDGRSSGPRPIYTVKSLRGNVTISFSPDDQYLLSAGVDNEIRQYVTADGRLHCVLDIQETGLHTNYTRAYYADGGATIISGSSEETVIRAHSSVTGEVLHTVEMFDGRLPHRLYLQSLRGHPARRGYLGALVSYYGPDYSHSLVTLDMFRRRDGTQTQSGAQSSDAVLEAVRAFDNPLSSLSGPLPSAKSLVPSPSYITDLWQVWQDCQVDGLNASFDAYCTVISVARGPSQDMVVTVTKGTGIAGNLGDSCADVTLMCGGGRVSGLLDLLRARLPLIAELLLTASTSTHDGINTPILIDFDESFHADFHVLLSAIFYANTDSLLTVRRPGGGRRGIEPLSTNTQTTFRSTQHVRLTCERAGGLNPKIGPLSYDGVVGASSLGVSSWDPVGPQIDVCSENIITRSHDKFERSDSLFMPTKTNWRASDIRSAPDVVGSPDKCRNMSAIALHGTCIPSLAASADSKDQFASTVWTWTALQTDMSAQPTESETSCRPQLDRTQDLTYSLNVAFDAATLFGVSRLAELAIWRVTVGPNSSPELTTSSAIPLLAFCLEREADVIVSAVAAASRKLEEFTAPVACVNDALFTTNAAMAAFIDHPERVKQNILRLAWCCLRFIAQHRSLLSGRVKGLCDSKGAVLAALIDLLHEQVWIDVQIDKIRDGDANRPQPLPIVSMPLMPLSDGIITSDADCRPPEEQTELALRLAYYKVAQRVDPIFDRADFPHLLPRVHAHAMVTACTPGGSPDYGRALIIGGHNYSNDLSSKVTYNVCSDEAGAPVWSLHDNVGDRPRSMLYHCAAPIGGGPARFFVTTGFMDSILPTLDTGPGSSSWISPPDFVFTGEKRVHVRPFACHLRKDVAKALALSRIFVLDTIANRWQVITPEWSDVPGGWGSVECDMAALPKPAMEYVPTPRYGATMCNLECDVMDPSVATEGSDVDSSARKFHLLLFGGHTEKYGETPVTSNSLRNDVAELAVTVTPRANGAWAYSFAWRKPPIIGTHPSARTFHSATTVSLPQREGGNVMVIFGGQSRRYQQDTHVLLPKRQADGVGAYQWQMAEAFGQVPSRRSSHTMTSIASFTASTTGDSTLSELQRRTFVIFGGVGAGGGLNDLTIGTLSKHVMLDAFVVTYSQPDMRSRPTEAPCARKWHTACFAPCWRGANEMVRRLDDVSSTKAVARALAAENFKPVQGAILVYGGRDSGHPAELPSLTQEQETVIRGLVEEGMPRDLILEFITSNRDALGEEYAARLGAVFPPPPPPPDDDMMIHSHMNLFDAAADDAGPVNEPHNWWDENVDSNLYVLRLQLSPDLTHARRHGRMAGDFVCDFAMTQSTAELKSLLYRLQDLVTAGVPEQLSNFLGETGTDIGGIPNDSTDPVHRHQLLSKAAELLWALRATEHSRTGIIPLDDGVPAGALRGAAANRERRLQLSLAGIYVHADCKWERPRSKMQALLHQPVPSVSDSSFVTDMMKLAPDSLPLLLNESELTFLQPQQFANFSLYLGGRQPGMAMKVYASLLRARSYTFRTMLSETADGAHFAEAAGNSVHLWEDMDKLTAVHFIHYLLTDTLHPRLDPEGAMSLLVAAERYQVPRLAELAEAMLVRELNADNVLGLLSFIDMNDAGHIRVEAAPAESAAADVGVTQSTVEQSMWSTLRAACISYILQHFNELNASEDFLALDAHLIAEIKSIWSSGTHIYSLPNVDDCDSLPSLD